MSGSLSSQGVATRPALRFSLRFSPRFSLRLSLRLALLALIGSLVAPSDGRAFSGGPPDGKCGDPPNPSFCTSCHSSFPINSGDGSLTLTGLPAEYAPDSTYVLAVHLQDSFQRRWGFELTAIRPSDGLAAGSFEAVDPVYVQVSEGDGDERDYVKQTSQGTFPNQSFGHWEILWTTPTVGAGPAHFYWAGNAANYNFAQTGDFVYASNLSVAERQDITTDVPSIQLWANGLTLDAFPNPTYAGTELRLVLGAPQQVRIEILDVNGRLVRRLASRESLLAGVHERWWDGRDERGRVVGTGVYFVSLHSDSHRVWRRVVRIR